VAESPEPRESLIKREADLPAADPIASKSTSGWMLVSALLLTISIAWALYDEAFGQRPWKGMQREFVARYTRYLDSIKNDAGKSETEIKESPEYQQLEADEKAAREAVQPEIQQIDTQVASAQRKLDAITDTFQNQRGRLTVISYSVIRIRPKRRGKNRSLSSCLRMMENQLRIRNSITLSLKHFTISSVIKRLLRLAKKPSC